MKHIQFDLPRPPVKCEPISDAASTIKLLNNN